MYAAMLTLILLPGAEAQMMETMGGGPPQPIVATEDVVLTECDCESGCGRCGHHGRGGEHIGGRMGPMPHSGYTPRYGCYPGSSRTMHRYPAFHGTFYRRPYNYRDLFDYPWHAKLHEPTSLFTFNVPVEEVESEDIPPVPAPSVSEASHSGMSSVIVEPTPQLRPVPTDASPRLAKPPSSRRTH